MSTDTPAAPVLLVEDDLDLAGNVQDYLERQGWRVDYAPNGALALHRLLTTRPCAVVLDLRLPGLGGLELCRRLRAEPGAAATPVLMLTAADTLDDRLAGFAAGADDYLVKPFALPELLARLRALVRRAGSTSAEGAGAGAAPVLRLADLELDPARRVVRRAGEPVPLTNMAFALLELLLRRSPAVVPRAEIEHHLWGDEPPGSDSLRTHMALLRAALEKPPHPPLLHTHRGVGYQILPPGATARETAAAPDLA